MEYNMTVAASPSVSDKQSVCVKNVAPLEKVLIIVVFCAANMPKLTLISFVGILHQVLGETSFNEEDSKDIDMHPIITTQVQTAAPYCVTFGLCRIMQSIKRLLSAILSLPFTGVYGYSKQPVQIEEKSYYSGYGSPSAYYPMFDPLSILASLAFLAFLFQSLAPLFDRSRSMISTAVQVQRSPNFESFDTGKAIFRDLKK